ncbi:two-component system response regulator YesN [Fontibacillus phaseoli]|uniref:Two-component system response regulator YesN n=1 Tax=Fontibacillus phaseoli TaxID=1416533 RepID=A0A369BJ77_9BACL|nr:response regulator [Fontibacillus phaseoli]RCX21649.1 two-component system response regulator YesN [Fontibacillus phaseoli]
MLQVLLVDDEPLVHHHLWTMSDWKSHGFELCGEAYSGSMALQAMEQSQPDIAIIDVNMPGMNGVELQRTIREHYPNVKTIMLSSYDDYDYVRECLRNGAVDYLLKHRLDEQSLISILKKAEQELREEAKQLGSKEAGGGADEGKGMESVRERVVQLFIGLPGAAQALEEDVRQSRLFANSVRFAAAAVQIVPFRLLTESRSDMQINRLVRQAVELVQQSLGDPAERMAVYVENGRLGIVFAFKERSEQAAASEAARLMSNVSHSLGLFLNLKCIYAIGHICGSMSKVESSYREAERSIDPSASLKETDRGSSHPRLSLTIEEQKQLLLSIERLDKEGVRRSMAAVFTSMRKLPLHSPSVQVVVSELLSIGEKTLPLDDAAAAGLPSREELENIGSMAEIEQWLLAYFESLLDLLRERQAAGPYSRHVSQAILLILERYHSYITLELAASVIGLNPSYLSRIFKVETQMTFSEYVNRVRIDASCKLLESGRFTVKQISSQVGFTTYNYFFKVFKESTGMTPHAYMSGPARVSKSVK